MSSTIQWEEDWFSLVETEKEQEKSEPELMESIESIKEWIEKDVRQQEKEREKDICSATELENRLNQRIGELRLLVQQQADTIHSLRQELSTLREDLLLIKGEIHSTSRSSMTQLLEELKRVKERELNYALRRHQPIPFFDSKSLLRMVGSVTSVTPVGSASPLFRSQMAPSTKL